MVEMYPWEKLTELVMDSGTKVWVRSVPPYVTQDVHAKLPPPPKPNVKIVGADGHEEIRPALPDSPEFDEYADRLAQYKKSISTALINFELDYAIVKWQFPGEGEGKFHTSPPKGWTPPKMVEGYNVKYKSDRIAFIKVAIIQTMADQDKIEGVMIGASTVTLQDIKAALVPTDSPEEESQ